MPSFYSSEKPSGSAIPDMKEPHPLEPFVPLGADRVAVHASRTASRPSRRMAGRPRALRVQAG